MPTPRPHSRRSLIIAAAALTAFSSALSADTSRSDTEPDTETPSKTEQPTVVAIHQPTYTEFGVGHYDFDSKDKEFDDTTAIIAGLERTWANRFGTALRYTYATVEDNADDRERFNQLDAGILWYGRAPSVGWQPYLGASLGGARLHSQDRFVGAIDAGIRWHINTTVALRMNYRFNHRFADDLSDHLVTFSVSSVFGR